MIGRECFVLERSGVYEGGVGVKCFYAFRVEARICVSGCPCGFQYFLGKFLLVGVLCFLCVERRWFLRFLYSTFFRGVVRLVFRNSAYRVFRLHAIAFSPTTICFGFLFFVRSNRFFTSDSRVPCVDYHFLLQQCFLRDRLPVYYFASFHVGKRLLVSLVKGLRVGQYYL